MRFLLSNNVLQLSTDLTAKRITSFLPIQPLPLDSSYRFSSELQQLLSGKKLLSNELPFPHELLHEHYLHGYLSYNPGVTKEKHTYTCQRCGNNASHRFHTYHCARCQQMCTYCRHCIQMGRVSECTPLFTWIGSPITFSPYAYPFAWTNTLSPAQQAASMTVVEAVKNGKSLLIWAVCGAGKTEMLFQAIHSSICNGKRVCIATPRTDVVLELLPRFRSVFPQTPVAALYGGAPPQPTHAPLVLSTTHQLLRYKDSFDVMMVDEVDAFPYSMDPMLQHAVKQAAKKEDALIYVTATPSAKWQQEVRRKKREAIVIPARYHRRPLPVPTFKWCGAYKKQIEKASLPRAVFRWIHRYLTKKPIMLFVPNISLVEQVTTILQKVHPAITGIHAEDKDRKEKVQAFRDGQIPILVTTTILERGVTIEGVQVAVLGVEQDIFTESALVQIAGRVGRSTREPSGDVIFFHQGKTTAMLLAKQHIERMNKKAKEQGMIDDAKVPFV